MRHERLQFVTMTIFVMGFLLASSGWSLVLSNSMLTRADWSTCGQEMCSCLPTTMMEPDCPLCLLKEENGESVDASACQSTTPTDAPKRLPKEGKFESVRFAAQTGCASLFISLVLGFNNNDSFVDLDSAKHLIVQDHLPLDPIADHPTPPPRA